MASGPDILEINCSLARKVLVSFVREEITRTGLRRAVVGVSGGIDSALSCYLAAEALRPENVLAVCMPYKHSSPDSLRHAGLVIQATQTSIVGNAGIHIDLDGFHARNCQYSLPGCFFNAGP